MEGLIRFPLAGSVVRDRAETFRISPLNTDMRKVGPGAYRVLRRPKKRCRQAVLARRLPIPDGYAADQMGKVEVSWGIVNSARLPYLRFIFNNGTTMGIKPNDLPKKLFVNLTEYVSGKYRELVWAIGII